MNVKNRERFYSEYSLLHASAIGVSIIRTREPFRALDTLREWAYANRLPYKVWSMLNGWNTYDPANANAAPTADNTREIATAVAMIDAISGGNPFSDGVYPIMWPHFQLAKIPALIQMLAELTRSCSETDKRVPLIVPPGFEIPAELQDSVAVLDFDPPNREELRESYARVFEMVGPEKRPRYSDIEVDSILNTIVGMTEIEADSAISRAIITHRTRLPNVPIDDFVDVLMKVKVETIKRSDVLEIMPVERMENVGGLAALKEWVDLRKDAFTAAAAAAGVDRPKGLLLVGPPGTGKSLAAKAIAHGLGQPLIRFDINRLYAGLVGASEARTREALKLLEAMAPAVAMIDELDKAVNRGGGNDGGVSTRVLGAILTFMQESKAPIFWVATANRVDNLPSELVRKGRLDEIFSVVLPTEDERREILSIHLRKRQEDPTEIDDLEAAITGSASYVGAEIEAAVKEAKLKAYRAGGHVTGAMIAAEFKHTKPLSEAFKADFDAMQAWADNNARPAAGAAQAAVRARVRQRPGEVQSRLGPTSRRLDTGGGGSSLDS